MRLVVPVQLLCLALNIMGKRFWHTLRRFTWFPLVCFGVSYLLMQTEPMKQLAWRTLDWRTNLRAYFQAPADPRIEIVLFEDNTENNLVAWPPDRSYHGMLMQLMALTKVSVVSWDVILDAPREGDGDASMWAGVFAVTNAGGQVITGSVTNPDPLDNNPSATGKTQPLRNIKGDIAGVYGAEYALLPFQALRDPGLYGFVDAQRGADGIIREIPFIVRVGQEIFPSYALQTLMAYYKAPADKVRVVLGDAVYLPTDAGEVRVPISAAGMYFINYRYDHDDVRPDFPTRTYVDTLIQLNDHYVENVPGFKAPDYAGKIVFIGQTVTGRADAGPTPRSSYAPLVLMHANVVNNVLAHDFARRVPDWLAWLGMLALTYTCVWLALKRSITLAATFTLLVIVLHLSLALWGWIWWSLWFPWIGPLLGLVVTQFIVIGRRVLQEQRAKQEIKGMFGSYVSPALVERLVEAGTPPQLGGHRTELTAYFSDIQSFSSFSEQLAPEQLVDLMNEYLTVCTDIIQEEGGTLDKYIGDAVVAMFGAPIPLQDHAYRACVAAARVQGKLLELRAGWEAAGDKWPEIVRQMQSRIGLNSGQAVVGNMGSRTRFNYTMMGDDVNLAARMESGAKSWGAYTMCTEATKLACEQSGGDRLVFRALGKIVVMGRSTPVPIFELTGLRESLPATAFACIEKFEAGLARYLARDWAGARELFEQSAKLEPNQPGVTPGVKTNPSRIYLDIVARYEAAPPPEDWNGVFVMKEK